MLGIPIKNACRSHGVDFEVSRILGLIVCIDWKDGDASLVKHAHNNVLRERTTALIDVGLNGQTIIEPGIDNLRETVVFIHPYVSNICRCNVHGNSIVYRGYD